MLDDATRAQIRHSAALLHTVGDQLVEHFYQRLLRHHPELGIFFNATHLHKRELQAAMSRAAAFYAEHNDQPENLQPMLQHIACKHASLGVRPEHYPLIGEHMLKSLEEVLGPLASETVLHTWRMAFSELSGKLIAMEAELYRHALQQKGGFSGWRRFAIGKKEEECQDTASLYLYPVDGGRVPAFLPGQYISLRGLDFHWNQLAPRQYSLSAAPNGRYLRITAQRETDEGHPPGQASELILQHLRQGDEVELSMPQGDFVLQESSAPAVLIGNGIGLTPLLAMLESRLQAGLPAVWVYGCPDGARHPLRAPLRKLLADHPATRQAVFYEHPAAGDKHNQDYHFSGHIDLSSAGVLALPDAHYYLSGPAAQMRPLLAALRRRQIAEERIHYQNFGPGEK